MGDGPDVRFAEVAASPAVEDGEVSSVTPSTLAFSSRPPLRGTRTSSPASTRRESSLNEPACCAAAGVAVRDTSRIQVVDLVILHLLPIWNARTPAVMGSWPVTTVNPPW